MPRRRKSRSTTRKPRFKPNFKLSFAWLGAMNWQVAKRSAVGVGWMAIFAAVVTSWTLGVPRLQAFASQRNHVDHHDVVIRFVDQPQWVNGALADSLLRTATMQVGGDPLVRDDLVAIRQALLDTGWLDSVDQVRRVQNDLVEIHANFVRPYTLVRDSAGYHLIDITGRLLPKSYAEASDLPVLVDNRTGQVVPMIAISGVHFKRPAPSKPWEGADVAAGLKLLRVLDSQPWSSQIAEIDVSNYLKGGPIRLRTDKDSVILWGGPPGEEAALELLADGKIERLNLLYKNHGRIDGNRLGELDITGEKVAVAR